MNTTTITLNDVLTRDLTADEIKSTVIAYEMLRKNAGVELVDIEAGTLANRFEYYFKSVRRLNFSKYLPEGKTASDFGVAVGLFAHPIENTKQHYYTYEFRLMDGETPFMTFVWAGKQTIVTDANGETIAEGAWRDDVRPLFAAEKPAKAPKAKKEKVLKKAATPAKKTKTAKKDKATKSAKAPKKTKTVAEVKAPVRESPADPDVLGEINAMLGGETPVEDPLDEMLDAGESLPV